MAKETFLFRRTKMSERGKSNSISRSRTHTSRSTAEKQTSKNKNRSESDHSISDTESRERNEEKCCRRYLTCVWEKKERQRWRVRRSGRIHKQNHKSNKTQTLYEREETQHGAIKRERGAREPTYLFTYSLLIYLPSYLVTYLFPYLLTYLLLFLPRKWNNFLVC